MLNTCNAELLARNTDTYLSRLPFPHAVIDGMFDESFLRGIASQLDDLELNGAKNFAACRKKYGYNDWNQFTPEMVSLIRYLSSAVFIEQLEKLTGIENLEADPYLEGGGIHRIARGGFLKMHADFNYHRRLNRPRRVNVLIYLNKGWKEDWGGRLVLSSRSGEVQAEVTPLFNRTVIFNTTDYSYHGHPEPLFTPEGVYRNSIALYYYSKPRPSHEISFGRNVMTRYVSENRWSRERLRYALYRAIGFLNARF